MKVGQVAMMLGFLLVLVSLGREVEGVISGYRPISGNKKATPTPQ